MDLKAPPFLSPDHARTAQPTPAPRQVSGAAWGRACDSWPAPHAIRDHMRFVAMRFVASPSCSTLNIAWVWSHLQRRYVVVEGFYYTHASGACCILLIAVQEGCWRKTVETSLPAPPCLLTNAQKRQCVGACEDCVPCRMPRRFPKDRWNRTGTCSQYPIHPLQHRRLPSSCTRSRWRLLGRRRSGIGPQVSTLSTLAARTAQS